MTIEGPALPLNELRLAREIADAPRLLATIDALGCLHMVVAVQLAIRGGAMSPLTRQVCEGFLAIAREHFAAAPEVARFLLANDAARDVERRDALAAAGELVGAMQVIAP